MVHYSLTLNYRDSDGMTAYSIVRGASGRWTVRKSHVDGTPEDLPLEFISPSQALMYLLNGGHQNLSSSEMPIAA